MTYQQDEEQHAQQTEQGHGKQRLIATVAVMSAVAVAAFGLTLCTNGTAPQTDIENTSQSQNREWDTSSTGDKTDETATTEAATSEPQESVPENTEDLRLVSCDVKLTGVQTEQQAKLYQFHVSGSIVNDSETEVESAAMGRMKVNGVLADMSCGTETLAPGQETTYDYDIIFEVRDEIDITFWQQHRSVKLSAIPDGATTQVDVSADHVAKSLGEVMAALLKTQPSAQSGTSTSTNQEAVPESEAIAPITLPEGDLPQMHTIENIARSHSPIAYENVEKLTNGKRAHVQGKLVNHLPYDAPSPVTLQATFWCDDGSALTSETQVVSLKADETFTFDIEATQDTPQGVTITGVELCEIVDNTYADYANAHGIDVTQYLNDTIG